MIVTEARQAFGSEVRLRLIRHYLDHPGSQKLARDTVGASASVVSSHTLALEALGVVVVEDGVHSVDQARLDELRSALVAYLDPPEPENAG